MVVDLPKENLSEKVTLD